MKFLHLLFLLSLAFLWSCVATGYEVVTPENYDRVSQKGFKRKFIYLDETMGRDSDREQMARILNKKNWTDFNKGLQQFNKEEKIFLRALRLFFAEQYNGTIQMLGLLNDYDFNCQVQLLKTDCLYLLEEGKEVDIEDYKAKYQEAYDCARSERVKYIIRTRYRFLRYGS